MHPAWILILGMQRAHTQLPRSLVIVPLRSRSRSRTRTLVMGGKTGQGGADDVPAAAPMKDGKALKPAPAGISTATSSALAIGIGICVVGSVFKMGGGELFEGITQSLVSIGNAAKKMKGPVDELAENMRSLSQRKERRKKTKKRKARNLLKKSAAESEDDDSESDDDEEEGDGEDDEVEVVRKPLTPEKVNEDRQKTKAHNNGGEDDKDDPPWIPPPTESAPPSKSTTAFTGDKDKEHDDTLTDTPRACEAKRMTRAAAATKTPQLQADRPPPAAAQVDNDNDKMVSEDVPSYGLRHNHHRHMHSNAQLYVGRRYARIFVEDGKPYGGTITKYLDEKKWWRVRYDDGDEEDRNADELELGMAFAEEHGFASAPPPSTPRRRVVKPNAAAGAVSTPPPVDEFMDFLTTLTPPQAEAHPKGRATQEFDAMAEDDMPGEKRFAPLDAVCAFAPSGTQTIEAGNDEVAELRRKRLRYYNVSSA